MFIGCVIAAPYAYLSGGSDNNFILIVLLSPAVSLILLIAYGVRKISYSDNKKSSFGTTMFWLLVVYFCLPIILNGASLLLKTAGYESISQNVFNCRYFSLLVLPTLLLLYIIIAEGVGGIWQRLSKILPPEASQNTEQ